MYECFACVYVYMCTMCMHGGQGDQKRALDSPRTKVSMVVSHRVGAGDSAPL